ncbi:MAG: NADH-quinone oxidoreductase subunit N [Bdellovibrionales bacterium]|nr:NADH-quinone oxidoreductase subunit N [Bdellovibrionales bacterium]
MQLSLVRELYACSPILILSLGAILLLLIDVFYQREWPRAAFSAVLIVLALGVATSMSSLFQGGQTIFKGFLYADPFSLFFCYVILAGALLSLLIGIASVKKEGIEAPGEYYALFLMSTAGALMFAWAAELIMLFLGLEIMSMALYCLCGAAVCRPRSSESALKYFFLGSFSSAFLLYGIAIVYGLAGTMSIPHLAGEIASNESSLMYIGIGLVLIGLVFKLGVVPFHFWAPDVYEGAPTPITAYMACVIKAAALAVAMRVLWTAFGEYLLYWSGAVWTMAALTMLFGNLVALRQRSLKRMLAYSSIAHAGYILVALLVPGGQFNGGAAALYYIVAYTVMTIGAFSVVLAVSSNSSAQHGHDDIARFNGLGYTSPFLGAALALFMLSLAGIPPGMAGLLGKFYVFSAAVQANYVGIAIIGVISSAISCYYYLRVIVAIYFVEPDAEDRNSPETTLSFRGSVLACMIGVVLLGIFPVGLYEYATRVMLEF